MNIKKLMITLLVSTSVFATTTVIATTGQDTDKSIQRETADKANESEAKERESIDEPDCIPWQYC